MEFNVTNPKEDGHTPLEIFHRSVVNPLGRFTILLFGRPGETIFPLPFTMVQVPVPIKGMLALRLVELWQITWFGPALETLGGASKLIFTLSRTLLHSPLSCRCSRNVVPANSALDGMYCTAKELSLGKKVPPPIQ